MPSDVFPGPRQGHESNHQSHTWHVYAKNGRINSDERRVALLCELSSLKWHFICFSETRCLTQDVILRGGHRLITFLESPAASGVGILVHSDYTRYIIKKYLISDRTTLFHLHALVRTIMKIPIICHLMFFLDRDEGTNPIISRTLGMYTQKMGVSIPTNVALRSYANLPR